MQSPSPEQTQTITRAGLVALYAELGEARHEVNELRAQLLTVQSEYERMREISRKLMAEHGPGLCEPGLTVNDPRLQAEGGG